MTDAVSGKQQSYFNFNLGEKVEIRCRKSIERFFKVRRDRNLAEAERFGLAISREIW